MVILLGISIFFRSVWKLVVQDKNTWKLLTVCKYYQIELFMLKYDYLKPAHILVGRVFVNDPGDLGWIPGHFIPKALKMVLDDSLLNTQQYKVRIKGKMEQCMERSSTLPNTSV